MAFLDLVNTGATKVIAPGVTDLVFRNDPLVYYLKQNSLEKYEGGPSWQVNFVYGKLKGDWFNRGTQFDITNTQTKTGMTVTPRRCEVNITIQAEDLEEIRGTTAAFNLVDTLLQEAALGMSARIAIAAYNHGQNVGGVDRTRFLNGLAEGINDGTTASWQGNTFANYMTLTRNDANIATALNAPMTNPASNVAGPISYSILERSYNRATYGAEMPNIGLTTNRGMSFVKLQFQPQQRFETQEPEVGFIGLKFNKATIMQSQYCPGADGVNDADLGNYLDSDGETFWWLNTKYIKFYVSTDPKFAFGFTGFKPAQDNLTFAGQYLYSGNLVVTGPRYHFPLYSITG